MTINQEFVSDSGKYSERRARQRLRGLWWGAVLIWVGLVFGADSLGLVPQFGDADAWSWIFLGAGVFGILGAIYRVASLSVPNATTWDWVWSGFCLIVGVGGFTTLEISWPLILMLVGGAILVNVFWVRD